MFYGCSDEIKTKIEANFLNIKEEAFTFVYYPI